MDAATLQRAMEPFFTTKGPARERGSGFRWSTASQSNPADIQSESRVGEGTTAELWLPVAEQALAAIEPIAGAHQSGQGKQCWSCLLWTTTSLF